MKTRWTPRPTLVLALLLAVALSEGGHGGGVVEAATADSGWVPISGPTQRGHPVESPRFGSRITKSRQHKEVTTVSTPTKAPAAITSTAKPTSPSRARPPRQERPGTKSNDDDDEETKSLAQQVQEGKYGLIQNELFSSGAPTRPGILSYEVNHEVPHDTADNLGGLRPDEIWLSEGHVLVLAGGPLGTEGDWEPIDDYQAPPRQVKLPPNPSVPPPFPVQLQDGGPTGFVTSNKTDPFKYGPPPPGNFETGNGINHLQPPPFPQHLNGSKYLPPPHQLYRQENLTQDDDDPSVFYPPPYDFSYHVDNTTAVPPGPLVPGIVLPPPPGFFAPLNKSAAPQLFIPNDIHHHLEPPPPPDYQPPDHETNLVTVRPPNLENEIFLPEYPHKEPNVFFHHHGSPIFITKNQTPTRVQVSAPEKLLVYELPGLPEIPRTRGRTLVSSTPSPTALYYTLPPEPPIKVTIYSATPAPARGVKQHHTQTFFANAPKPRPFTTPKYQQQYYDAPAPTPKYQHEYYDVPSSTVEPIPFQEPYYETPTSTPKPKYQQSYYETPSSTAKPKYQQPISTPEPIHLHPDTTPIPETTTIAPVRTTVKPKLVTTESPNFFPSSIAYDIPSKYLATTTTPAPEYFSPVPKGRYLPIQDDYYYNTPPPRFVTPRPRPQYEYFYEQPQRRPEPVYYNQRPEYYYPQRPVYQTPAPAYDIYPPRQQQQQQQQQQQRKPKPQVEYFFPPRQQSVSTTQNPIFSGLYTQTDEKFMDDITKGYFNLFGQRLTTPLPPRGNAPTGTLPKPISLHDDTRVNYRRPLPPINQDSEFIEVRDPSVVSYQLPGQGQRGPSHYFFLTPRLAPGERAPREQQQSVRSPRGVANPTTLPRPSPARNNNNNKKQSK